MCAVSQQLLVGLGSPHGDDRVAWTVAEELESSRPDWIIRKASTAVDLFDWLEGVDRLIVIDACRGAGAPGSIVRWRWPAVPLTALRGAGSHDLGLAEVLQTATRLGTLPSRVEIIGIEIGACRCGEGLSEAAAASVEKVVAELRSEVGRA
ncbi:MAG: hydrogenase maturation protease [Planctomycetaceae bacterium]|nr:hydrogenase maturation protease [Planctomycetaceae bacterium]